jgi:alpha-ketoglutarate-dependent 2,4-dichlorophenoxyacetate dioxygenase
MRSPVREFTFQVAIRIARNVVGARGRIREPRTASAALAGALSYLALVTLTVRSLHPVFAAELTGADLRLEPSPELVRTVEQAMARHGVLAIRDQHISDEQHLRFSRAFGPLELPPNLGMPAMKRRLRSELYDASNLDENGEVIDPDSPRRSYNRGNELFHTDSSFNDLPTKWSLLLAHALPPARGDTEFVDLRAVYADLPAHTRERIEGLVAEHNLWHSRERGGFTTVTDEMKRLMPPVRHPLVRTAADGRPSLYIGAHASHIVGWPVDDGRALLDELNMFATQPRFVYAHRWRDGDLVIWDNRCTLHRATSLEDIRHPRDLRRTTVNEHGPERASTDDRTPAPA